MLDFSWEKRKCIWNKTSKKHSTNLQGQTGKSPVSSLFSQMWVGLTFGSFRPLTSALPTFNKIKARENAAFRSSCFHQLYIYLNYSIVSAARSESFQTLEIFWLLCLLQLQAFISNWCIFYTSRTIIESSSAPRQSLHSQATPALIQFYSWVLWGIWRSSVNCKGATVVCKCAPLRT